MEFSRKWGVRSNKKRWVVEKNEVIKLLFLFITSHQCIEETIICGKHIWNGNLKYHRHPLQNRIKCIYQIIRFWKKENEWMTIWKKSAVLKIQVTVRTLIFSFVGLKSRLRNKYFNIKLKKKENFSIQGANEKWIFFFLHSPELEEQVSMKGELNLQPTSISWEIENEGKSKIKKYLRTT